jgi:hypothetical protein
MSNQMKTTEAALRRGVYRKRVLEIAERTNRRCIAEHRLESVEQDLLVFATPRGCVMVTLHEHGCCHSWKAAASGKTSSATSRARRRSRRRADTQRPGFGPGQCDHCHEPESEMDLMKTFDSLPPEAQEVVRQMSNTARAALRANGIQPRNDDEAARLDEACAVFFKSSVDAHLQRKLPTSSFIRL